MVQPARAILYTTAAAKNLRRLIPRFYLEGSSTPLIKRLLWIVQDYARAWVGHGNRLEYLATRRAIMDYIHNRFGDCPDEVRVTSMEFNHQKQHL